MFIHRYYVPSNTLASLNYVTRKYLSQVRSTWWSYSAMCGIFEQSKAGVFILFYFYNIQNLAKFNNFYLKSQFYTRKKIAKRNQIYLSKMAKICKLPVSNPIIHLPWSTYHPVDLHCKLKTILSGFCYYNLHFKATVRLFLDSVVP